jgi:pilus assembly protein Flp/PilA
MPPNFWKEKIMIGRAYFWLLNFPAKLNRDEGQGLVEYALILLLIAMVVIGVLKLTGDTLNETYQLIRDSIPVP